MNHHINYEDEDAKGCNIRGFKSIYDAYSRKSIKKIEAVFLADDLHSLLTPELIDFINDSPLWKEKCVFFKHKVVD